MEKTSEARILIITKEQCKIGFFHWPVSVENWENRTTTYYLYSAKISYKGEDKINSDNQTQHLPLTASYLLPVYKVIKAVNLEKNMNLEDRSTFQEVF